jgi:hypothetical protein
VHQRIPQASDGLYTRLSLRCESCEEKFDFTVNSTDLNRWHNGLNTVLAFPYLGNELQEMLRRGICLPCQQLSVELETTPGTCV